jgi:hypothetical protein
LRGVILCAVLFGVAASGAGASTESVYTVKPTSACLTAHKVLVSPIPRAQAVPAHVPVLAAINYSFALIPAQAVDHGEVVFERDAATAQRAWAKLYAINVAEAAQVQGISLAKAAALIRQALGLHGNAITIWANHPFKAASRTRVVGCLR